MNMILLTGVAGFIGFYTAELLLEKGYTVVGLDNLNDYYDTQLKDYRLRKLQNYPNFTFFNYDIEDLNALNKLFNEYSFDVVINLAARAGVRYSVENPHIYMSTNAQGVLNILECMRQYSVPKLVLASTSSLYANQKMPFNEDLPVNTPISPYAASKKAAEVMAYTYHGLHGIDVSVVRYFTVYGPHGRPDMSIFRFIKWINEGHPVKLLGDGTQGRDFSYVTDIAAGTVAAMKKVGYEIINFGAGSKPRTMLSVIEQIEDTLGKKAIIERKPFFKADLKNTWSNIEKAKQILGWEPLVDSYKGLEETIQWHVENRAFVKNINV